MPEQMEVVRCALKYQMDLQDFHIYEDPARELEVLILHCHHQHRHAFARHILEFHPFVFYPQDETAGVTKVVCTLLEFIVKVFEEELACRVLSVFTAYHESVLYIITHERFMDTVVELGWLDLLEQLIRTSQCVFHTDIPDNARIESYVRQFWARFWHRAPSSTPTENNLSRVLQTDLWSRGGDRVARYVQHAHVYEDVDGALSLMVQTLKRCSVEPERKIVEGNLRRLYLAFHEKTRVHLSQLLYDNFKGHTFFVECLAGANVGYEDEHDPLKTALAELRDATASGDVLDVHIDHVRLLVKKAQSINHIESAGQQVCKLIFANYVKELQEVRSNDETVYRKISEVFFPENTLADLVALTTTDDVSPPSKQSKKRRR